MAPMHIFILGNPSWRGLHCRDPRVNASLIFQVQAFRNHRSIFSYDSCTFPCGQVSFEEWMNSFHACVNICLCSLTARKRPEESFLSRYAFVAEADHCVNFLLLEHCSLLALYSLFCVPACKPSRAITETT